MKKVSISDNRILFHCPGCDRNHAITTDLWNYNGNTEAPTFTPSVLVTYPANPEASEEFKEWRKERTCHSYITDGKIQFLSDCTHHLAGQTVDLPDYE